MRVCFALVFLVFKAANAGLEECKKSLVEMSQLKYSNSQAMIYYSGRDLNDLGMYYKCNSINNAKYVLMIFKAVDKNFDYTTVLGFCGPETCYSEDYEKLIESLPLNIKNINNFIYANNTRFYMTEEYSNKPIISGTMIFVIFVTLLVAAVCIGTYTEHLGQKFSEDFEARYPIIMSFSIIKNKKY